MHFLPEACTLDTPVVLIRVPFVCVLSSSSHFLLGNCIGHRQGVGVNLKKVCAFKIFLT